MNLKSLITRLKLIKLSMISIEKQLKYSRGELGKYEYLTGGDLGYRPNVIQKAKFEYSPLGRVFNKRLDESDKKEGPLKRLKNIEGKNEEQLSAIKT